MLRSPRQLVAKWLGKATGLIALIVFLLTDYLFDINIALILTGIVVVPVFGASVFLLNKMKK